MAFIRTIPPQEATGELRALYDEVQKRRGAIAHVYQIHSLRPETLKPHMDLYLSILYGPSDLSRLEREAIAVVVSRLNGCEYCVAHHAEALARYEKDSAVVDALKRGTDAPGISDRLRALLEFAERLTTRSFDVSEEHVEALRRAGLGDEEVLTATLTAGYFNFVNRLVQGLGVELEPVQAEYKY